MFLSWHDTNRSMQLAAVVSETTAVEEVAAVGLCKLSPLDVRMS